MAACDVPHIGWLRVAGRLAAFSVSASRIDETVRYIQRQAEHHRTLSFENELERFLDRHGVEYDPRYVFG